MAEAKKTTKKTTKAKAAEEVKAAAAEVVAEQIAEVAAEEVAAETVVAEEKATAKAGKRSAKAIKEVEEKVAKEERKAKVAEDGEAPTRPAAVPTRSRLERRGKLFRKSAEKIEVGKLYPLEEALKLTQATSHVKFDATVELHVNLNVDPRHADQNIRDVVVLPAGTGKSVRVAVLTEDAAEALKAGADIAGTDELLAQLEKGVIDFDVLVATPALMAKLGKYARVLGPRGLMPNPKSGTVTTDVNRAVAEAKAGKIEYRVDTTGIIHVGIGKVSFTAQQLLDNANAIVTSLKSNKPTSIKGIYFKNAHVTSSMGPSIAVDLSSIN